LDNWTTLHVVFAKQRAQSKQLGERWCEAEVYRVTGEIALIKRDALKSETHFERAHGVARQQQASPGNSAPPCLARLWRDQGKVGEARELLAPVYEWFSEGFDTRDLKEAKALLEELAA
jgi:predicted ATPase